MILNFFFKCGVHRTQRVPPNENYGRIHSATISVSLTPKLEDEEVSIIIIIFSHYYL